jgi:hypothetical protein
LSADDTAKCETYLDAHLTALVMPGRPGTSAADYQPALDGRAVNLTDVVDALLPLTLFGRTGDDPSLAAGRRETRSELFDLASRHYDRLVADAVKAAAANPQQPNQPRVLKLPPNLLQPPRLNDAPGWGGWKSGFDDYYRRLAPATQPPRPDKLPDWFWTPVPVPPQIPLWKQWADSFDDFCKQNHIDPDPFINELKDLLKLPDDGKDDPNRPRQPADGPPPADPTKPSQPQFPPEPKPPSSQQPAAPAETAASPPASPVGSGPE